MDITYFDAIGILFFLCVAAFIYKRGWFFSFYSFFKFLIVFAASFSVGLLIASRIPNFLPLTNLQWSLVIQGALFIVLWKLVSFRKIFFTITDKVIPINRLAFVSGLDRLLNIFPSALVAFFACFFIFTILISQSTNYSQLASAIETSTFVKPIAYQIYFASLNPTPSNLAPIRSKLFEGVAFNHIPSASFTVIETPTGEAPAGGTMAFTPDTSGTQVQPADQPQVIVPTSPPAVVDQPTTKPGEPTPVPAAPNPAPTIIVRDNTETIIYVPPNTPTPVLAQPTTIPTQIPTPIPTQAPIIPVIPILQPPPVNIGAVEQDIFRLTNQERAKNNLPPFVWDGALANVARLHSQDMNSRNFFDHTNPDGLDPFARMRKGGIQVEYGAENIAGAPTADMIVANWMNSPGHRANILNPIYTKLGVGVARDSKYGLLATQNFTN